ncbi:MAG: hypothetical protein DWQ36_18350 [Acidobacteria bacterium]|nr:MAG: hypothetical protein DWQ30_13300 [Acidobacteriota bacterium]REK04391.1 MAG: hypothetical protein DWQ36_18350 [Acidobacteriota bacterium]
MRSRLPTVRLFGQLAGDLAHGVRRLRRAPASAVGAVVMLAIGLAAVAAISTLIQHALLRPVPLDGFDRVVQIGTVPWAAGGAESSGERSPIVAPIELAAWRDAPGLLEVVAPVLPDGAVTLVDGLPERVATVQAGSGFFDLFDLQPLRGRRFEADDPADRESVLLAHSFWQRAFAGAAEIVGRTILVDGRQRQVVGVLGPELEAVFEDLDLLEPLPLSPEQLTARAGYLLVLGRRAPGVSLDEAEAALAPAQERLNQELPVDERSQVAMVTLRSALVGDLGARLWLLLATAGAVLLIACSNVAHLLLARSLARTEELRVRMTLGASRRRIVAQLLGESLAIGLLAATLAVVLTTVGMQLARGLLADMGGALEGARVEPSVVLSCAVAGALSVLAAGLWPARAAARSSVPSVVRGPLFDGGWFRRGLVTLQVGVTVALLGSAGLMIRSSILESGVERGFETGGRLSALLSLPQARYGSAEAVNEAFEALLRDLRALPGVEAVGLSNRIPLAGSSLGLEYSPADDPQRTVAAALQIASPGFDVAAGMRLLRGRWIAAEDRSGSTAVAVVNRSFAESLWGTVDVVGRSLLPRNQAYAPAEDGDVAVLEIVGVVEDARLGGLRQAASPAAIVPLAQVPPGPLSWIGNTMSFVIAGGLDAETMARQVRAEVARFDPGLALFGIETLDRRLRLSRRVGELNVTLFSLLGGIALLLAAGGIYGLTASLVAQRRAELGLRLALGATLRRLVLRVVRWVAVPIAGGALLGIALLLVAGRSLRSQLFGVDVYDLPSALGALLVLGVVASVAAFGPARRAAAVDPVETLRAD